MRAEALMAFTPGDINPRAIRNKLLNKIFFLTILFLFEKNRISFPEKEMTNEKFSLIYYQTSSNQPEKQSSNWTLF